MVLITALLMVGLLILANALYVASEFGAVSARPSKIQRLAEEGQGLARALLPIIQDPAKLDRYIAASQIGITLSSLILGAYGQSQLAPLIAPLFRALGEASAAAAESASAGLVLIGLSALQMILGELVPKSVAMQFPHHAALVTAIPMRWSLRLFRPFIWLLNGSGLAILKLLGVSHSHRHVHSPREIEMMITESGKSGVLEPEERRWLHRALDLGIRRTRDVMVPRESVTSIDFDATVEELLSLAIECPYTRLPVRRGTLDEVVGLVDTKDLALRLAVGGTVERVKDVMRPVLSVSEDLHAGRLLVLLREHHAQQAVVTGRGGVVVGIVTLEDVLAEVFGSLSDELKAARSGRRPPAGGDR